MPAEAEVTCSPSQTAVALVPSEERPSCGEQSVLDSAVGVLQSAVLPAIVAETDSTILFSPCRRLQIAVARAPSADTCTCGKTVSSSAWMGPEMLIAVPHSAESPEMSAEAARMPVVPWTQTAVARDPSADIPS